MISAVEFGLIYGVMALGVFLTFRVLNFADLTVDGSSPPAAPPRPSRSSPVGILSLSLIHI